MRDRTFFAIVLGCFAAGLVFAASLVATGEATHRRGDTVALSAK
jgi:hypothetical protein